MNFYDLAKDRYSVRKFRPEHLSKDEIDTILKAGMVAPTGCNFQAFRILVINGDESAPKLAGCTDSHFHAPAAMVVCYHKNECWYRKKYDGEPCGVLDATIVGTHLMLQAHEIGVGSTWVMSFDPSALRNAYNLPDELEPVVLLVMGHPAEDARPAPQHDLFRPVEDLVYYDTF